jgi:hypothetical protein
MKADTLSGHSGHPVCSSADRERKPNEKSRLLYSEREILCAGCGTRFEPVPPSRRYCRPSCKVRSERRQPTLPGTGPVLTFDSELPPSRHASICSPANTLTRLHGKREILPPAGELTELLGNRAIGSATRSDKNLSAQRSAGSTAETLTSEAR